MKNLRKYGKAPFNIAVIHGGPGVPGEMAPVARQLSTNWGILEPLQTAISLEGQVQELKSVPEENGSLPITILWNSFSSCTHDYQVVVFCFSKQGFQEIGGSNVLRLKYGDIYTQRWRSFL